MAKEGIRNLYAPEKEDFLTGEIDMVNEAVHRWMNELSAQGIFTTDENLVICGWNHWLEISSGQSASAIIGQHLFDAYPELVERGLNQYYEEALAGQARVLSHRFHKYLLPMPPQVKESSFTQMQQSVRIAPLLSDQRVIGTITVIEDVTERIAREEQLIRLFEREHEARKEAETANRMKDEFLATVSHELRTPLNAMVGWLQILRSSQIDPVAFAHGLETIERNAKAQSQIVEDILDVSRIITGKLSHEVKPINLVMIIEDALEAVRLAAQAKGIRLRLVTDTKPAVVAGDPNRLQQIVWNLVSNAIKFTPQGGSVRVQLMRNESQAEITVTDTGKGIAPEFLPYVFDRFRQADSTSTRQHSGLGLGLAIVRHLVEIHGGTVDAASPGEGQGASFMVRLPLYSAGDGLTILQASNQPASVITGPQPAPQNNSDSPQNTKLDHTRVLIVEDDVDALEMLRILLSQYGAEVRTSNSTQEALGVFEQWVPDVLVSDIGMPNEDGYFLIQQIRARDIERGGQVPAIALTGFTRPEDQQQLLLAGYHVPLAKPVNVEKLVEAISRLTSKPKAQSEQV